jgi:uncharacterized protein YggE
MQKQKSFAYLAVCLGLAGCMHPRAIVLSPSSPQGVRVNGVGDASAPPDIARTRIGIDVRAAVAEQASDDAAQRMAAVIAALKALGIADKDLRTFNYSISFEQEQPPQPPPQPQPKAAEPQLPRGFYHVTNMLEVTIRDLKAIGRVLQAATNAGANNIWGVSFDLENDAVLVAQARKAAVADAQQAASELAKLSGVELAEVVSLSEAEQPAGYGGPTLMSMRSQSGNDVPIEQGEITVHYGVQIVYATHSK